MPLSTESIFLLISLQLFSSFHPTIQSFDICEYKVCVCITNSVTCNDESGIEEINIIKRNMEALTITGVQFSRPSLTSENMTSLTNLESLKITNTNLRVISPNTFQYFRRLRNLDLSQNKLSTIEPGTFNALILNKLYLENIRGIQLEKTSFKGLKTKFLYLRNNDIYHIDYETLENLNLQELSLSNNQITNIDPKFKNIFNEPPKILDLSNNPLNCTCTIAWLRALVITSHAKQLGVKIKCASPKHLEGRDIADTLPEEIACPKPQIKSIFIDLQPSSAELTCTAYGQRTPNLKWTFDEGDTKKMVVKQSEPSNHPGESRLVMNVTVTPERKSYTCIAWTEQESRKQSVIISLRGPSRSLVEALPPVILPNNKGAEYLDRNGAARPSPPPDIFYEKQFNLVQMLGAVFGTFISTFLLLGVIHYCVFYSKKQKALKKPYWTTHDSAYSATGSHEYDVPRIDPPTLPPPPPMSMYPRTNEIEFLDFKTQTKLYR